MDTCIDLQLCPTEWFKKSKGKQEGSETVPDLHHIRAEWLVSGGPAPASFNLFWPDFSGFSYVVEDLAMYWNRPQGFVVVRTGLAQFRDWENQQDLVQNSQNRLQDRTGVGGRQGPSFCMEKLTTGTSLHANTSRVTKENRYFQDFWDWM